MTAAKAVVPRAQARADVDLAIDHYASEAGADVAIGYIAALERAFAFIGSTPAAGSSRWAHDLNLPGLRSVQLKGFPWLVFYVELESHIDVWRVLMRSGIFQRGWPTSRQSRNRL